MASDADELRSISLLFHKVAEENQGDDVSGGGSTSNVSSRPSWSSLPRTEQGEADRGYLREVFDGFMQYDDHVAAFDLLDRGRRAAQEMTAVARATTGSSDELRRFLQRADGYRDALSKRDWSARAETSIRDGSTFCGIPFRQNSIAHAGIRLRARCRPGSSMARLRFPNAHRPLRESMDKLLRFVGLPLQAGGVEVVDTNQDGFAHIRATLARPVTTSPLPAFGSACAERYEVVVGQTRKEPAQFEEYIRGCKLGGSPGPCVPPSPHSPRPNGSSGYDILRVCGSPSFLWILPSSSTFAGNETACPSCSN